MEENNAIRAQIKAAIDSYNEKEANYQSVMKGQQSKMQSIEARFKQRLEGEIKDKLDRAKDAKDKYDSVSQTCESLAT